MGDLSFTMEGGRILLPVGRRREDGGRELLFIPGWAGEEEKSDGDSHVLYAGVKCLNGLD